MTDRNSMDRRGPSDLGDGAKWLNVSGETVPAYGVVQFKANYAAGYNQASKPDGGGGLYFANGGVDVLNTKHGESLIWKGARLVLLEGSPTVGTFVGPTTGSWAMSESGSGFIVMHQAVGGVGSVIQVGGGSINVQHGIVTANLGCGYYTIEKATWSGDREEAGSGLGSGSGTEDCDPCYNVTGGSGPTGSGSGEECGIELTTPPCQVTGTGEYVTAYDSASTVIPLIVGTSVKMINMGDTNSATGSGPGSGSDATPIWQILRGMMKHIVEYKERWECCDGSGQSGVETLIGRTPVILIGTVCEEIICGTCEVGSGSGSA